MTYSTNDLNKTGISQFIQIKWPQVTSFEILWEPQCGVRPIEYDGSHGKRTEFPPVAVWYIGKEKYSYVLHPEFKVHQWNSLFFKGYNILIDYSSQENVLMKCIQWSIDGVHLEEINRRLELLNGKSYGNNGRKNEEQDVK